MKQKLAIITCALTLVGCASDPLMTGEAHDWVGHLASDLKAALGEPTHIIHQSNVQNDPAISRMFETKGGESEIWEYISTGDTTLGKSEHIGFNMSGRPGSVIGSSGGVNIADTPEHQARYENLTRFEVRGGMVVKWYQSHSEDGVVIWSHH